MKLKSCVSVATGERTNVIEIPDQDLEGVSQRGREEMFAEHLQIHIDNSIDSWWEVVEEAKASKKSKGD